MKLNNLNKRPSPAVERHSSKKVASLVKILSQSLGDYEVANNVKMYLSPLMMDFCLCE